MVQTVAVIGAGPSGLTSIKSCLDEGLQPTCFESSADIGGLWNFKEKPEPGQASIYNSVVMNSSKEMMSFSDFPPPAELPNNMHHTEVVSYLRLYAQNFNLLRHIHFQTTVVSVRQRADFAVTGQWEVETESREKQRETHVFDAVMVCTGHFTHPHLPLKDFPGIEHFQGRYLHSWEYRNAEGLQGKRVVVVGMGNSGGDIAVDASRVAERVYLSTRSGGWVFARVGPGGLPFDIMWFTRKDALLHKLFPSKMTSMLERKLNEHFDHHLYGLAPKHHVFAQIPLVNDHLPCQIISGRVQLKPNVEEFTGNSVHFVDGTTAEKVDVVVFATGYNYNFPFLPATLQEKSGYRLKLYRHIIPPALSHPTLAVVGFISGFGTINTLSEMQARWATRVFKGLITLPTEATMMKDIEKETVTMHQLYRCSDRNPMHVDYLPYMDSLAEEIGVLPKIMWLFLKDPKLGLEVFRGPVTSYQYRLKGPGRWPGARQAILTQWDRVFRPFRTRVVPEDKPKSSSTLGIVMTATAITSCTGLFWWFLHTKSPLSASLPLPAFLRFSQ